MSEPSGGQLTPKDRVCANCAHFRRRWHWRGLMDFLFDLSNGVQHYRCVYDAEQQKLNEITCKVTVYYVDSSCATMRQHDCKSGRLWEPSKEFSQRKENLFKMLSMEHKETK